MTSKKNCDNLRERIAALGMGELDATEAEQVKRHIKGCESCRKLYESMVAEEQMIRSTFDILVERRKTLEDAVAKKAEQHRAPAIARLPWWRSPLAVRVAAVAAAAVLIIAAIVAIQAFTSDEGTIEKQEPTAYDTPIPPDEEMPNRQIDTDLQKELRQIDQMFADGDVTGLIEMLEKGQWETKTAAAGFLGRIGDARACEALAKYVDQWKGLSAENPFTSAIEQIDARLQNDLTQAPPDEPNETATDETPEPNKVLVTAAPTQEKPKYVLSGHITDALTGGPVTDAKVEISLRRVYDTQTDANGFYAFKEVKDNGNYRIGIASTDYIGITDYRKKPIVNLKNGLHKVKDFQLERACQIEITVVDEQGDPIKDARIRVSSMSDEHGREVGKSDYSRRTNENGLMLLGGFEPSDDSLLFTVTHEVDGPVVERDGHRYRPTVWDYAAGHLIAKLSDPDVIETSQVVLCKGIEVKGYCEYADGVPAHGLRISAHPNWWHCTYYPPIVDIDENGFFTLPQIVPGQYSLHIHIPKGGGGGTSFTIGEMKLPVEEEPIYTRVPRKSPGSLVSISGRIIYLGDKKPSRVEIDAYSRAGGHEMLMLDGEETFTIGSLEPGKYTLRFEGSNVETKTLTDIEAPSEGLVIELKYIDEKDAKPVLTGTVVRADTGEPVKRFRARARKLRTLRGANYVQEDRWAEFANPQGTFSVQTVGPGVYQVQIAADGLAWLWSEEINTDENHPVTFALSIGGSISGKVTSMQGEPIAGATVIPLSTACGTMPRVKDVFVSTQGSVKTADDGTFVLNNLAAGYESIKVTHDQYTFSTRGSIPVAEGQTTAGIDFVLTSGGSIEGYVLDTDGNPEPTVTLYFQDDSGYGGSGDAEAGRFATAITDANGFYHVDNLPEKMCYIRRSDSYSSLGVVRRTILPQEGRTLRLDFGGVPLLDGQLIVNEQPLANVKVMLADPTSRHSGPFQCYARTDAQGSFRFVGVQAGRYAIYYEMPDKRGEWIKTAVVETTGQYMNLGAVPKQGTLVRIHIKTVDPDAEFKPTYVTLQEGTKYWGNRIADVKEPTEPGGPYVVEDAIPGTYTAVLAMTNLLTVRKQVVVGESPNEIDVTVTIPAGSAVITGQFLDEVAQPLVLLNSDNTIGGNIYPVDGQTYRVENLPAGTYSIGNTFAEGSAPLITFDLAEGEVKTIDIDTSKWQNTQLGSLKVRVVGSDGLVLTASRAWLDGADGPIYPMMSVGDSHSFISTAGKYTLHVEWAGYEATTLYVELKAIDFSKPREADRNTVLVKLRRK